MSPRQTIAILSITLFTAACMAEIHDPERSYPDDELALDGSAQALSRIEEEGVSPTEQVGVLPTGERDLSCGDTVVEDFDETSIGIGHSRLAAERNARGHAYRRVREAAQAWRDDLTCAPRCTLSIQEGRPYTRVEECRYSYLRFWIGWTCEARSEERRQAYCDPS